MDGAVLEHVFEEKDLGIIIDSQLKFDEHISTKVKKAKKKFHLLRAYVFQKIVCCVSETPSGIRPINLVSISS